VNSAASFPSTYDEARKMFCEAASRSGALLERFDYPERGPDGTSLSCDVAWFGPRNAEHVLVLVSGTHGVEGFCGSGAQVDALRRGGAAQLPANVGVLMVHAINPYGFAWLRRVTHENIDLNRNWIDFERSLPENPGYNELHAAICPSSWNAETQAASAASTRAFGVREGATALQFALSGGQYRYPAGVYYGGVAPSWSRRTQTVIFEAYLKQAGKVAIIDYHTGLGPWGFGEQISTEPRPTKAFRRAASWFGSAVSSTHDGSSTSSAIVGDGLSAAAKLLPQAEVTTLALEFGTLSTEEVMRALLADAWLHAHGDPQSPLGQSIKADIRAAFFGDSADWKGMVAGQSLLACRQAIAGLLAP